VSPSQLRQSYAILGAQRNFKILGIFCRLWLRDGKPSYLKLLPRVWRHVWHDLEHPSLAPVRHWMESHIPASWQKIPEVTA
jgi:aminoglycoside/choline kinase family phosphotransferase